MKIRMIKNLKIVVIIFSVLFLKVQAQTIDDGLKLYDNEKYDSAKTFFQSMIDKNKSAPENYFYLGKILLKTNKVDEAQQVFQSGIDAASSSALNYGGLGAVYLIKKDTNQANKYFGQASDNFEKKNTVPYVEIAGLMIHYGAGNYEYRAIELLNKAIQIDRKYYRTYLILGDMYLYQNKGSEAIANYQKAVDYNSKSALGYVGIGKVYAKIKNTMGAESSFNDALNNDSTCAAAYRELAELNYSSKKYDAAVSYYKKYIDCSEKNSSNLTRYATFLYLNKNYKDASAIIDEVLSREPDNAGMIQLKAYALNENNDFAGGISAFEKYFSLVKSEDITGTDYEFYAKLLLQAGKDSLGLINLKKAVDVDSTKKDLHGDIAEEYYKLKDWKDAAKEFELKESLTGKPLSLKEYFDLGQIYYKDKQFAKADEAYKTVTDIKPDLVLGYYWRAITNTQLDTTSELGLAKPYFEKLVELAEPTPDKYKAQLIDAYNYLGYFYYLKKDDPVYKDTWKDNSLKYFTKLKEIDPENKQAIEALKNIK
jgi:tetratricopeptide (TPR) repeat protein